MIRKNGRRVLTGILCAALLVSEAGFLDIRAFASDISVIAENIPEKGPEELEEGPEEPGMESQEETEESGTQPEEGADNPEKEQGTDMEPAEKDPDVGEEDSGEEEIGDNPAEGDETIPGDEISMGVSENTVNAAGSGLTPAQEILKVLAQEDDLYHATATDEIAYVIRKEGKLVAQGSGDYTDNGNGPWDKICQELILTADIRISNMTSAPDLFADCTHLTGVSMGGLGGSPLRSVRAMFFNCSSLPSVDVSALNTSQLTEMYNMFAGCSNLVSINLNGFNTSQVTDMNGVFFGCNNLSSIDVSGFNTSQVADMHNMFFGCNSLNSIDLSSFDTGRVKNMNAMFQGCSGLSTIDLSGFDTSQVTDMSHMFRDCSGLTMIDLSSFDAGQATSMSDMLEGCDNLESIRTPRNVKESVKLPGKSGEKWYQSDGTEVQYLPQNLSASVVLGKGYVPDEVPEDIYQEDITIIRKGYACTEFLLKNNKGKIQKETDLGYMLEGEPNKEYRVKSDKDGWVVVRSPLLENISGEPETKQIKTTEMTLRYASGITEPLEYGVIMEVTVNPLSFTQSWELGMEGSISGSLSAGAGGSVGPANAQASLAEAKISGSKGGTLSVEHAVENGTRQLTLFQSYGTDVAVEAEVGPAAKAQVLGQEAKIVAAAANAGVAAGNTVGIGLKLEDYDPNDPEQLKKIGAFLAESQAQAVGNCMLLKALDLSGLAVWNQEQFGVSISNKAGVDLGKIELGDNVEGTLASVNADRTISFDTLKDKTDSTRELTFADELSTGLELGAVSVADLERDFFSDSDDGKLEISVAFDGNDQVENFSVTKENKYVSGFLYEKGKAISASVTYDRETVEQIKKNIKVVSDFISGSTQYIFGDVQQELFEQLDTTPLKGTYVAKEADLKNIDIINLGLGISAIVGLDVDISMEGAVSCEYEIVGGTYEKGRRHITNRNCIEPEVEKESCTIWELVEEPLVTIMEKLRDYLQDIAGSIAEGVTNGWAEIKEEVSDLPWVVHIVSLKENAGKTSALQSYAINAYSMGTASGLTTYGNTDTDTYKAYTVGDPYCVYVTDGEGRAIPDYSANPLTLTLSYTDEMLAAAGLSGTEINHIGIYRYSEDLYGYLCIGGTVDAAAKAVSVKITEPGQYVLAVDSAAPLVKEIKVSKNSNKPLITVAFNEASGFRTFSMQLDGEEVIGTADWNRYYNKALHAISYQVERELAEGKHTCSVYAVDTAGNAMPAPYEMEFYIEKAGPDEPEKPGQLGDILEEDIPADGVIPDGIWAAGIKDYTYTGGNIAQSFRLYDNTKLLKEKTDYTVSLKNNKNAYTYEDEDYKAFEENLQSIGQSVRTGTFDPKKAPQVIIQMKGNYAGKKTVYFKIAPADLSERAFEADDLTVTYTNKKQTPVPKLLWNGKALKYGTDFYVFEYDQKKTDQNAFKEPAEYTLTLTGKKNFTGEIPVTLTISKSAKQIAMSKVTVKGIKNMSWTGQQIVQTGFTVKHGNKTLTENDDFTVSWGINKDVGTGTVTFTGTGKDEDGDGFSYVGVKKVSFKITGTPISKAVVSGVENTYTYTGAEVEPEAKLTYQANKDAAAVKLDKDVHYKVTYQKNREKGTATILFTGLPGGGYTGTKKQTFAIRASAIGDGFDVAFQDAAGGQQGSFSAPYMKGGAKPQVVVTFGGVALEQDKDYKVSYANNKTIASATDNKAPTVTIKGKGNYIGSKSVKFSIVAKPLTNENGITVVAKDKAENKKANGYRQGFKVYDADGKALGNGDYDKNTVVYTLLKTRNADGTETEVNEVLDKESVVPADSVIQITVKGKGIYAGGEATGTYRILKGDYDIGKATIKINAQEYTGRPVQIRDQSQFAADAVFIKVGGVKKTLTLGQDIEVVPGSYVKNVNKGTAKVTFRGINDYGGTKTVSYQVGSRSIADFWRGIYTKMTRMFGV